MIARVNVSLVKGHQGIEQGIGSVIAWTLKETGFAANLRIHVGSSNLANAASHRSRKLEGWGQLRAIQRCLLSRLPQ